MIPKTGNMAGTIEESFHCYDLWAHSLHTVCGLPEIEDDMYSGSPAHDIGKPDCCSGEYEGKPNMHYYGHPRLSRRL